MDVRVMYDVASTILFGRGSLAILRIKSPSLGKGGPLEKAGSEIQGPGHAQRRRGAVQGMCPAYPRPAPPPDDGDWDAELLPRVGRRDPGVAAGGRHELLRPGLADAGGAAKAKIQQQK